MKLDAREALNQTLSYGAPAWKEWRHSQEKQNMSLAGIDLSGLDLTDFDFNQIDLSRSILRGSRLWNVNFTGANLSDADLSHAQLNFAVLIDANLENANLEGADLAVFSAQNANLRGAILRNSDIPDSRFNLELLGAQNLEYTHASSQTFLMELVTEALKTFHRRSFTRSERLILSPYLQNIVRGMRCLRVYYPSDDLPSGLIEVRGLLAQELVKYLAKHPRELYNIHPRQFEELVAEILASFGWEIELTPATKDGGFDIFAISKDNTGLKTSWVVECKKYKESNKVGVEIARSLYAVKGNLGAANALLATTSYFTKGVELYKTSRYDFETRDFNGIVAWLQKAYRVMGE